MSLLGGHKFDVNMNKKTRGLRFGASDCKGLLTWTSPILTRKKLLTMLNKGIFNASQQMRSKRPTATQMPSKSYSAKKVILCPQYCQKSEMLLSVHEFLTHKYIIWANTSWACSNWGQFFSVLKLTCLLLSLSFIFFRVVLPCHK